MIYIGLDLSTKTGIAVIKDHAKGHTVSTKLITTKKQTGLERADYIANHCMEIIEAEIPFSKHIVASNSDLYRIMIEGYGFVRTQHIIPLIEVGTVVRYRLFLEGYKYIEIPPTSLKKFVTGKGNVKKEMMLKEVYKRWKIDCDTNDEADAVGLAYFGKALDGKLKLPKENMKALEKFYVDSNSDNT